MPHNWIFIAVGRVCVACSVAQAKDEYDDTVICADDKPYSQPVKKPPAKT